MSRRRAASGITLLELIVVMTIVILIVAGVLTSLTQTSTQVWARTDSQMVNGATAQQAVNRITEDLRRAHRPITCASGFGVSRMIFTPADDSPPVTYAFSPFSASGTSLIRSQNGVDQVMAGGLSTFSCTYGSEMVSLQLTVQVADFKALSTPQTLVWKVWVPNP